MSVEGFKKLSGMWEMGVEGFEGLFFIANEYVGVSGTYQRAAEKRVEVFDSYIGVGMTVVEGFGVFCRERLERLEVFDEVIWAKSLRALNR